MNLITALIVVVVLIALAICIGFMILYSKCYQKVIQSKAIVRTGWGGTKVSFDGIVVYPIIHRAEVMDISVKRVEIERSAKDGLICADNIRADIKVAFFVRVNKTAEDVLRVAQSIGCARGSDPAALVLFFDAKFSEALKTVGKRFEFVDLYTSRVEFKDEILQIIGTDLNGYVLDDAAIDYLEQTPLTFLQADNILDAEGIKKITDLTAKQRILANHIDRDREKTIRKQDVEAEEAILELNRQLAESTEKQKREVISVTAREEAEGKKIQQEERLKSERARITTEEEVRIAEEQRDRQVIVAQRNKERTDKVETERVEKDRELEATERERIVELARIEKEKALEQEKRAIQDVIRERVIVERATVEEEEKIKDTRAFAEADRAKQVKMTEAQKAAEELLIAEVRAAEARRQAAELMAKQRIIEAEAEQAAAEKQAVAMTTLAKARAEEEAIHGMSEVKVMEARALALEKEGRAEAAVIEAKAAANQKQGEAEANVLHQKMSAEAKGIDEKAAAMKKLDGVGKEHEEFRLRLDKEKAVELASIHVNKDIAEAQASIIREGLKTAKVEIIGGESTFFDRMIHSIGTGRSIERTVQNSKTLENIRDTFFNGDGEKFAHEIRKLTSTFGLKSEDLKNLSISALLLKLMKQTKSDDTKAHLSELLEMARRTGLQDESAEMLDL